MKFNTTKITTAGVLRCCIHSINDKIKADEEVEEGQKLSCEHCDEDFELVKTRAGFVWTPEWQLKEQPQADS